MHLAPLPLAAKRWSPWLSRDVPSRRRNGGALPRLTGCWCWCWVQHTLYTRPPIIRRCERAKISIMARRPARLQVGIDRLGTAAKHSASHTAEASPGRYSATRASGIPIVVLPYAIYEVRKESADYMVRWRLVGCCFRHRPLSGNLRQLHGILSNPDSRFATDGARQSHSSHQRRLASRATAKLQSAMPPGSTPQMPNSHSPSLQEQSASRAPCPKYIRSYVQYTMCRR